MPQYQVDSERIQSSSRSGHFDLANQAGRGRHVHQSQCLAGRMARFGGHPVHRGSRTVACGPTADGASLESIQRSLTQASTVYADAEIQLRAVCQLVSWLPQRGEPETSWAPTGYSCRGPVRFGRQPAEYPVRWLRYQHTGQEVTRMVAPA